MRAALVTAVLLAIARSASAQEWSWTEHAYPEQGFRVEFNGPVLVKPLKVGIRGTQYLQEGGTYLYVVAASLGTNLDEGAASSFAKLDCRRRTGEEAVKAPWGVGREVRGADCIDGSYEAEARYHQSGDWFYQVIALYKEAGGDAASARYFLRSFRLTP